MIEKGMKVFAYQVDSGRTDIATVDVINNYTHTDAIDYEVSAENGDCYITPYVCPIGNIEKWIRANAIEEYRNILIIRCVEHLNKYGKSKGIGHLAIFNIIDKAYKQLKEHKK